MDPNVRAPSDLSATAVSEGINKIDFTGGDAAGNVVYEVWRRHGDTVDWYLHGTTAGPSFEDSEVKPGQYYEYKIRAVMGESASEFSESAVAYGK
ncbi:MAG: fibronectin type III domain-containing protein [Pyrinomonadaceae bacterium]